MFFGWAPWEPLATHRGFTHGVVGGVLVLPPLLALLLWVLDRWQVRRGRIAQGAPPLHFGWLLALSYLGALTHPLLDLQTVYAVQLLSPFNLRWFHSDGLFIISPWLLVVLGLGVWRSRKTVQGGPALKALIAATLFIVLNVGISVQAWNAPRVDAPYANPDRIFAAPEPLWFWRRDVVWRQQGQIVHARFDPLNGGLADIGAPMPDNMADPDVQRAATATTDVRMFLAWSQMPFAKVKRLSCVVTVTFGDARFADPRLVGGFTRQVELPVQSALCPSSA